MKKIWWVILIIFVVAAFVVLGLSTHNLAHYAIELQRSFNRDLAARLRAAQDGKSLSALLEALGLGFTYGVVHALGPGHGKFVVTTYFLAHERKPGRGFLMGTQIAVMHVVSAIVLVLVASALVHYMARGADPDMPWLKAASYGFIALIGLYMLFKALHALRHPENHHGHEHCAHSPSGHDHHQTLLSLGVGLVPCSGAVLILIYTFANNLVLLGLAMVGAIAIGMALTMSGLGLASIFARRFVLVHLESDKASKFMPFVQIFGAVLITFFGSFMALMALNFNQ